jgi:hypothetical protein
LSLFDAPSYQELVAMNGQSERLSVTVQPRLKKGWQVRIARGSPVRQLHIPPYLSDAPHDVKQALIHWALLPIRPTRPHKQTITRLKKNLERIVWNYALKTGNLPSRRTTFDPDALIATSRGTVYDLREVFDSINRHWFDGTLVSFIRWGTPGSRTSYQMQKTDRSGNRVNLITIAGVYDHPRVPRFAIESIMYHEMLHIAIPPDVRNGRRVVHGAAFKAAEKRFPRYLEWRAWEKTVLPYLKKSKQRPI